MNSTSRRPASGRARRAGRPSGDERDFRHALLDAALALFARTGIAATSLRAIAEAAGVTPAMLHYYFGGKPQLVQALIEERLQPAVAPLRARLAAAGERPAALVEAFVRGMGELVAEHPWMPPLWVREVVCEGGMLREAVFEQVVPNLPQVMARHFARAQAEGEWPAGVDPRLLVVSLVGLTLFPAAGEPIWRKVFAADAVSPEVMTGHVLALLGHGVPGLSGDIA